MSVTLAALSGEGRHLWWVASRRHRARRRRQIADRIAMGGLSGLGAGARHRGGHRLTKDARRSVRCADITEANENIVMAMTSGRRRRGSKEDIGELLSRDLSRVAGSIFAGHSRARLRYRRLSLCASDAIDKRVSGSRFARNGARRPDPFCRRAPTPLGTTCMRMWTGSSADVSGAPGSRGSTSAESHGRAQSLRAGIRGS